MKKKKIKSKSYDDMTLKALYIMARDTKGADIEKIQEALIRKADDYLKMNGSLRVVYYFARDISLANIQKLEDVIIKSNDAALIYDFALNIFEANIPKLEEAIIKLQNAYYILMFAKNIKMANISKLEEAIIDTGDYNAILKFAREVNCADKQRLYEIFMKKWPVTAEFLESGKTLMEAFYTIGGVVNRDFITDYAYNEENGTIMIELLDGSQVITYKSNVEINPPAYLSLKSREKSQGGKVKVKKV